VTNALLVSERKQLLRPADSARFLTLLGTLPIIEETERSLRDRESILSLARQQRLSAYDAAYLHLAATYGLPLATLDQSLKRAARARGISLA
jgi:predicted nucleic acid-binding protein